MGYQESIVEIKNESVEKQVKNYFEHKVNRKDYPMIDLLALVEVTQNFKTEVFNRGMKEFNVDQLYLYIGGERSYQRLIDDIEKELNIRGITDIVPIEDIEQFETHFKCIEKDAPLSFFNDKEITPPFTIWRGGQ
ncbi:hypothetical protein [Oceanobacillus oncorhynchi]|uniref:hypothetical protein n=1 Tax=Oceanobacillus oncorhynchi TaxID=545501 RepID=UPI001868E22E|nr:hypothetical protein [Oceanobacillus oncorhynchi]